MLSERIKRLTAYVPGEQPQDRQYIKLNTNENPDPPCPAVVEALAAFDSGRLRLYPDPRALGLREKLAEVYAVEPDEVFVGNGSDEVLSFCFYAFFDSPRGKVLFPSFTYTFYPVYCDFYGIDYERVPLDDGFHVNVEGFLGRNSCGIIFPNPNAPTGTAIPVDNIRRLLERYRGDRAVIVDEAYVDFGAETALPLIREHKNLLVIRTFSKSMSLAGLRLGFALGHKDLVAPLTTVKDSFNSYPVGTITQVVGIAALTDLTYYRALWDKITDTRDRFCRDLRSLGWEVLPSKANFVFSRKPGVSGKEIYHGLKAKGILVRHFDLAGIQDFVRITIGKDEDMQTLLREMKESFP